jgi:polar amino acid transport system substrate-binding protein
MSRLSRVTTVVAALAVAGMVAACGASTQKPGSGSSGAPSAAGSSSSSPAAGSSAAGSSAAGSSAAGSSAAGSSASSPAGSSAAGSSAAGSSAAGSSAAASSPSAPATGEPEPLDLGLAKDDELAALVPESIRSAGKLVIATDASYAPNEFLKNGQGEPIGMDIDLGNAIGQLLGLQTEWKPTTFDGILAGINAGRFDLSLSSFTDTKKREEQVNFVTYLQAGVSIVVAKGNPENIQSSQDLCGKKVGAENGTTEQDMLTKADVDDSVVKICQDAGKPAPDFSGYPSQSDVNVAPASGRLDAYMADTPVAEYAVKITGDKFEKVGEDVGVAPYGIALPKKPAELTTAVQRAVQKLMDDGDYAKILDNWGLSDGAIDKAEVNKAIF